MTRLTISIFLLTMIATGFHKAPAAEPVVADSAETRYLTFQLMTIRGVTSPAPFGANPPSAPTKAQMEDFVHDVVKAIGTTGNARHKLAFSPTHFPFDLSDCSAAV